MEYIPFIYFSILTLFLIYKNKGFDVAAYLSTIYAFSAFMSTVAVHNGVWNKYGLCPQIEIHILPTLAYCFLLTLTIIPFIYFNSRKIISIPLSKEKAFDAMGWGLIAVFIISLIYLIPDIKEVMSSNLKEVRDMVYSDEHRERPTGFRYLLALPATLFSQYSPLAIFMFYYNMCFRKRPWWFQALLLLSSMTPVLEAILIAGRTQPIYWLLNLLLGFVFFVPYMTKKQRRLMTVPAFCLVGSILVFMGMVTTARYGDGSLIVSPLVNYCGQSFINFCYFFDTYPDPVFTLERLFPFTHYFIIQSNFELFDYRDEIMALTGMNIGVFYTFLGDLMVDLGHYGMFFYVCIFCIVASLCMHREKQDTLPFYQLIIFLILVLIPLQGIFYYSYYKVNSSYYYIGMSFLAVFFKYRIKI